MLNNGQGRYLTPLEAAVIEAVICFLLGQKGRTLYHMLLPHSVELLKTAFNLKGIQITLFVL